MSTQAILPPLEPNQSLLYYSGTVVMQYSEKANQLLSGLYLPYKVPV